MSDALRSKLAAYNPELTLDRASTIPSHWYHDRDVYNHELNVVFHKTWQMAGRTAVLAGVAGAVGARHRTVFDGLR